VDGRILLKCIVRKWDGAMDWTDLAQNSEAWQAFVNVVENAGNLVAAPSMDTF
jgi:hypothetical protein